MNGRTISVLALCTLLLLLSACEAAIDPPEPTTAPSPSAAPRPTPRVGSSPEGPVNGYLAVAPRVLRPGQSETVSVSLFYGDRQSGATVQLALLKDGREVASARSYVQGRGNVSLPVPQAAEGDYLLRMTGSGFRAESQVRVEDGTLVFVETDKPIYKPGQTVHIRILTVDPQLRPVSAQATVEAMDAKGLKVFKRDLSTDEYGMASLDLPLSTEPNLGVWKLTVKSGKRTAQLDVRIERYVLPKYEVKVDLPKEWVLAGDAIKGSVSAEYSYGKPVRGEVEIRASRYVGSWQEFASVTKDIDTEVQFELPAVRYVSGVPGAGGMGNVQLDVTVREKATGYEEKTSRLLTVAPSPTVLKVIPEGVSFKPSLPFSFLIIAESPDRAPLDATVNLDFTYTKKDFNVTQERRQVSVRQGKALIQVTPPSDAISLTVGAQSRDSSTSLALHSNYSPTGSFINLEQSSQGALKVGDRAKFRVNSTKQASNFYYEVVSRGMVVFSDYSRTRDIEFDITPSMAPSSRLLVYQVLPTSEVAADYLPFAVQGDYPLSLQAGFDRPEAKPGEQVEVSVQAEGQARVGLAAVDRSVFILAENRLNLQQVFDELEKLYQKPQAELHEARPLDKLIARGAEDVFRDAGVVVMGNRQVPKGKEYESPMRFAMPMAAAGRAAAEDMAKQAVPAAAPVPTMAADASAGGLMEVHRVRQFFPETWIWDTLQTDGAGRASKQYGVPDSITTWMLRAVALSRETGLGVAEAQLKVMQPFFVTVDLPYSAIRGEQFPVKVALYNYQESAEEFVVELERADWFRLSGEATQTVRIGPNDLGAVTFTIQPAELGTNKLKVTARSRLSADAIVKELIVEPEGVAREEVENLVLSAGSSRDLPLGVPFRIIQGSDRAYLAATGSYLTQSIQGLEKLLQMPFGCGEQNMILFAPNVFVTRYLKETGQLKPEVMAKAEHLMVTGYQRQLTYRRSDGSFSAFGQQDKEGSLWLTSFVMKSFAQAKDVVYIDESVLGSASDWVVKHQNRDGSFDPVGFVHHQEMLGGLQGKTALTAFVAVALYEVGERQAFQKAVAYLEGALDRTEDAYGVALTAYALELAKSPRAGDAHGKLMALARESDGGIQWGDQIEPLHMPPGILPGEPAPRRPGIPRPNQSASIETTAYATLALVERGDRLNASRAARWLVSQRNSFGGFGSTQDTVVGLQALTRYAEGARADVDATVTLTSGDWRREIRVTPENADVLQLLDVPVGGTLTVEVRGKGQVVLQTVLRYNVPDAEERNRSVFQMEVEYGTGQIEVNDLIDVNARIRFTPPEPIEAGMVVVDIAVPTGFAPETDGLEALVEAEEKIKRYEVAGRKVIVYIENLMPEEEIAFSFQARALYPVKAQAVTSQAYAYYRPEWKGESLGGSIEVR
jgi:CD109 antigen